MPEDGVLWRVIAFNIGIEAGQLTAVMMMVVVAILVTSFVKEAPEAVLRKLGSVVVFAGGVAATAIVTYQSVTSAQDANDLVASDSVSITSSSCVVGDRETPLPAAGGHAAKSFFGPDEEAPLGDFGHSVGDGFVAILYPADLAAEDVEALQAWIESEDGAGVVAGAHSDLKLTDVVDSRYVLGRTDPWSDNISANVIGLGLGTATRWWVFRRFVFTEPALLTKSNHG